MAESNFQYNHVLRLPEVVLASGAHVNEDFTNLTADNLTASAVTISSGVFSESLTANNFTASAFIFTSGAGSGNLSASAFYGNGNAITGISSTNISSGLLAIAYGGNAVSAAAGFQAHNNGTNITAATSTWTKLNLATTAFNTGGFYSTVSSRWTPPAGKVIMGVVMRWVTMSDVADLYIDIWKNGATYRQMNWVGSNNGSKSDGNSFYIVENVNGTDYFNVYVWQNSGTTRTVLGDANATYFIGALQPLA